MEDLAAKRLSLEPSAAEPSPEAKHRSSLHYPLWARRLHGHRQNLQHPELVHLALTATLRGGLSFYSSPAELLYSLLVQNAQHGLNSRLLLSITPGLP